MLSDSTVSSLSSLRLEFDELKAAMLRHWTMPPSQLYSFDIDGYTMLMVDRMSQFEHCLSDFFDDSGMRKPTQWLKNHSVHYLWQISILIRRDFRRIFGVLEWDHQGYFLDHSVMQTVHSYAFYIEYPKGNHVLKGHSGFLRFSVVSSDGCYLFTCGRDNSIIVWDLRDNTLNHQWEAHDDYVTSLAINSQRGILASASKNGSIRIWNAHTLELIQELPKQSVSLVSIDINESGDELLSGGWDHICRLWSLNSGECLRKFTGHTDDVFCVRFIKESIIVTGSWDQSMKIWDMKNEDISMMSERTVNDGITAPVTHLALNCDASLLACVSLDECIIVYRWPDLNKVRVLSERSGRMCFHPLRPSVMALDDRSEYSVRVIDVMTGECLCSFVGHSDLIPNTSFTPDGHRLISVSDDKDVRVWDVSTLMDELELSD